MKRLLKFLGIILLLVIIIIIYSRYIGTKGFITKERTIYSSNIPQAFSGIKIVHFSDIHYKRAISNSKVSSIISEINLINPSIVIFTGDLIDETSTIDDDEYDFLINSLKSINAKYGKYAVLGEHDYKNKEKIIDIYKQSDFIYMENDADVISKDGEEILIYGIGNATYSLNDISNLDDYDDIDYKIILMHEPDVADSVSLKVENALLLAGHSHNGQFRLPIIGGILKPKLGSKYYAEHYSISSNQLYVSSGIGVSNFNYRLFNKPSINFYRINKN